MKTLWFLLSCWLSTAEASSLIPLEASQVYVKVPYSLGTHELKGSGFSGSVEFSEEAQSVSNATLTLEVKELKAKDKTLVCHMNESLTLDYGKSDFPEDHVCEDDKLPTEGKNSSVFPEIKVQLLKPVSINAKSVVLMWTIHGVSREEEVPVEFFWDKDSRKLRVRSSFSLVLKDYNISVKKFLFIGVKDKVMLELELFLGEK